jgi:hypothetical protein
MSRRGTIAIAVLAALVTAGSAALRGAPTEKLALVTVVADGGALPALTPADFTITEDKSKVDVLDAVPARDPLSVVLLADTALPANGAAATPELRRALDTFVTTLLTGDPSAQIALYRVANAAIPIKDFTSSRDELASGIDSIASGTPYGSAMLEAVLTATARVGTRPAPRRAIVCISVGHVDGTDKQPNPVAGALQQTGATLWVVSLQGAWETGLTNRDTLWNRATTDTGGLRQDVAQATQLAPHLQVVANSLLSQYFLKMARSREGAVKPFGGVAQGANVLFTHWMR